MDEALNQQFIQTNARPTIAIIVSETDILRQMSLLYSRTNVLLRKFGKCSLAVKLCLFRAHCIPFYGASLWDRFNKTVMKRFEAAYVKCVTVFFGFARLDSVTSMFSELGLPTFNTVLHIILNLV